MRRRLRHRRRSERSALGGVRVSRKFGAVRCTQREAAPRAKKKSGTCVDASSTVLPVDAPARAQHGRSRGSRPRRPGRTHLVGRHEGAASAGSACNAAKGAQWPQRSQQTRVVIIKISSRTMRARGDRRKRPARPRPVRTYKNSTGKTHSTTVLAVLWPLVVEKKRARKTAYEGRGLRRRGVSSRGAHSRRAIARAAARRRAKIARPASGGTP